MNLSFLEEPHLEFGVGRHIDIRFGIMNYGPLDFDAPLASKHINVGIVGSTESVDGVRRWLERIGHNEEIPLLFGPIPSRKFDAFLTIHVRCRESAFAKHVSHQIDKAIHLSPTGDG